MLALLLQLHRTLTGHVYLSILSWQLPCVSLQSEGKSGNQPFIAILLHVKVQNLAFATTLKAAADVCNIDEHIACATRQL